VHIAEQKKINMCFTDSLLTVLTIRNSSYWRIEGGGAPTKTANSQQYDIFQSCIFRSVTFNAYSSIILY